MEVQANYGDEVTFIGMPGLGGTGAMAEFVAETGVDGFVHVPDPDGALWERFGVRQHRAYVLVDDDGTVQRGSYGHLAEDVEELIAS